MKTSDVAAVHGLTGVRAVLKGTLAGKALAALRRRRHAPVRALRAERAARRDRRHGQTATVPAAARTTHRALYLVPAGPGSWPALSDTIESILHWEGNETKVVVIDDATVDCRAAVVQRRFPDVEVLRRRWPSGGPPRIFPMLAWGMRELLRRYDFEVICKLDTDALVTGPGLGARAAEALSADDHVGMIGTIGLRADGVPEDYTYDRWALSHSERWSPSVRRLAERARAGGYTGEKVHGGACLFSRRGLEAADRAGLLAWRPPWWSILNDELCFALALYASGSGLASFGAPGEPTVSGQDFLPLDKEEVPRAGKLLVHSVRRGKRGESEQELRAYFRRLRGGDRRGVAAIPTIAQVDPSTDGA